MAVCGIKGMTVTFLLSGTQGHCKGLHNIIVYTVIIDDCIFHLKIAFFFDNHEDKNCKGGLTLFNRLNVINTLEERNQTRPSRIQLKYR